MPTPDQSELPRLPESETRPPLQHVLSPVDIDEEVLPRQLRSEVQAALLMAMGWLQVSNGEEAIRECQQHGIVIARTPPLQRAFLQLAEQELMRRPDLAANLYQAAGVDASPQLLQQAQRCFSEGYEGVGKLVYKKLGLKIPDELWVTAAATHIALGQEDSAAWCHSSMSSEPPREQTEAIVRLYLGRGHGGVEKAAKYCEDLGIEIPKDQFEETGKNALDDELGIVNLGDAIAALRLSDYDFGQDPERRQRLVQRSRKALADAESPVRDDDAWNQRMRRHYFRNDGLQGLALAGEHDEVLREADRDVESGDLELALRAYMAVGAGNPQAKQRIAECARKILVPSGQRQRRGWRERNIELANIELAIEALLTPGIEPPPEAVAQVLKDHARRGWEETDGLIRAFGQQSQSSLKEAAKSLKGVEGMLALQYCGDEGKLIQRMRQHLKRGALWEVAKTCEVTGSVPGQMRVPLNQAARQALDELLQLNQPASQEEDRWEFNAEVSSKIHGVLMAFKALNGRIPQEKLAQLAQMRLRVQQADQARTIYEFLVTSSETEESGQRAVRKEQ